jgi:hypothetical protein
MPLNKFRQYRNRKITINKKKVVITTGYCLPCFGRMDILSLYCIKCNKRMKIKFLNKEAIYNLKAILKCPKCKLEILSIEY